MILPLDFEAYKSSENVPDQRFHVGSLCGYNLKGYSGAKSVTTLEILPPPPPTRDYTSNPWPKWPHVWRVDYGYEEVKLHFGRDPRNFNVVTKEFVGNKEDKVTVLCDLLSGFHENPPHSALAFSPPLTLVLGMLIRVCPIVTQSSFNRSYQNLPLAP
ncbi:unnamed protein product [Protopolystoma xenopodis]|uniref:Uncharacterized protein n=1 Tax=Protopolystoma xenopodis TaxID=117903 RepID=A0A448XE00_9PLAT|nr:unnamed protein product [Protopolystoma xenopodis]